ncbi:MAG: hypothetical protein ACI4QM_01700, partial [Alphaproteobacteria bacterium]
LLKMIKEKRPEDFEDALFVKHSFWEDFFILEDNNRLYRYSNHDRATIVAQTDKDMTIKWDNYGTETFKKETPTHLTQVK